MNSEEISSAHDAPQPVISGPGATLRAAREAKRLDLSHIAAETRIPLRHLEAIETDNFESLPSRAYAIGFARTYAKAVGLDSEAITDAVRAELADGSMRRTIPQSGMEPGDPARLPSKGLAWAAGAAVLIRFSALREAGFFDPTYFLYYEEVDLMKQVRKAGHEIWYVPQARVIHAEGAATGVKSGGRRRRRPVYWYQSWRYYYRKNHGRAGAILAALGWMTGAGVNEVIARLRGQTPHAPDSFFGDFWRTAFRPLIGLKELPRD